MIYFIQQGDVGPIKIGYCQSGRSVFKRLGTLQVGNPERLYLRAVIPEGGTTTERKLHAAFASARLTGEWFRPTPTLLRVIELADLAAADKDDDGILRTVLSELGALPAGRPRAAVRINDAPGVRSWKRPTKKQRKQRLAEQIASGEITVRHEPPPTS